MSAMKAWLDKQLNVVISKKLTVFIMSTVLLCVDKVEPSDWMQVAIAYIGTQGVVDLMAKYKGIK